MIRVADSYKTILKVPLSVVIIAQEVAIAAPLQIRACASQNLAIYVRVAACRLKVQAYSIHLKGFHVRKLHKAYVVETLRFS